MVRTTCNPGGVCVQRTVVCTYSIGRSTSTLCTPLTRSVHFSRLVFPGLPRRPRKNRSLGRVPIKPVRFRKTNDRNNICQSTMPARGAIRHTTGCMRYCYTIISLLRFRRVCRNLPACISLRWCRYTRPKYCALFSFCCVTRTVTLTYSYIIRCTTPI